MFIKNFKNIQKKGVSYPSIVDTYEWNKNNEKFEQVKKDWQKTIDENKHLELKEMIKRNIKPISDNRAFYGDTTIYANKSIHDFYKAANTEIVAEPNEQQKVEKVVEQVVNPTVQEPKKEQVEPNAK